MTVNEIAKILEGEVVGDGSIQISGVAKIEEAGGGMLSFIANPKYEKYVELTAASCVLVGKGIDTAKYSKLPPSLIKLDDPYASFVIAIEHFMPRKQDVEIGIHPTAVIHSSAVIGPQCSIGPYVVIGARVKIGNNAVMHPHVVIERDVTIGNDCILYSHVAIREECVIGNRVMIQSGSVIGSDGFGFAPKKDKTFQKIPQLGIVVIEDDVEIQSNTCIDRATLGETRVKHGTKIDNLVQIAHNVIIGENTVLAGLSGVAGSTKIGSNNMIGGGVSVIGHSFTANGVKIAGGTVVTKALDKEGALYSGYPAKEASKWRRGEGAIRQLPELLVEVRELRSKVEKLEEELQKLKK